MALDLKPEEKTVGTANFQRAVGKLGVTRRDFLNGMLAAGGALPLGAAAYFGYNAAFGEKPVKAGLIGAGDEGGVLVGEHNPRYLEFVAYSDIRPSNQKRIFDGEPAGPRKGFNYHYGSNARSKIRLYEDYKQLLADPNIEAVVIALPLNLHFQATMDALEAGKDVLCEKLMAWNIEQCKAMIKLAKDKGRVLSIGHQRHYSMLYAHANEIVKSGILGEVHHIRAQWPRNNANPRLDSNGQEQFETVSGNRLLIMRDSWRPVIAQADIDALKDNLSKYAGDWKNINELVRWRLYRRTGAGLMAELGSHQLDACSIFLKKVEPLSVMAMGGKHFYKDDREVEDHVYCTFEFPGEHCDKSLPAFNAQGNANSNDIVTVTYSSLNTNNFEPYGECVMGTKGTLIVEKEEAAYLFGQGPRSTSVSVAAGGALATSSTTPGDTSDRRAQELGQASLGQGVPSKGYREEMEDFACVIRKRAEAMPSERANIKTRCDGPAALKDAVMALVANMAMRLRKRIDFKPEWFNPDSPAVPEKDPNLQS